jgi:cyclohexyl-isocyanide hydratase
MDALAGYGAQAVNERVVWDGKVVSCAGVSAGIDMALQLAAELSDEETARAIQLAIEYAPQPPFDGGRMEGASGRELGLARHGLNQP